MKRRRHTAFQFKPPSAQQLKLMTWWTEGSSLAHLDGVIADGAIRSGKTVTMIDSFITWSLSCHSHEDFIVAGRSVGALKRNVLKPLFKILRAKAIPFYHHRSENWVQIGTNVYRLFGGSTEASQDDLAGLTAAGALVEEATRLKESFVKECVNRCSVDGSKLFWNCNPKGPRHWFKRDFVDEAAAKRLLRLQFTLEDNPTLSQAVRDRYRRMFEGVWYKRYILGHWIAAEGAVYPMFSEDQHVVSTAVLLEQIEQPRFRQFIVGSDHGTASSPTTFGLFGLYRRKVEDPATGKKRRQWFAHKLKEYRWSGKEEARQKTNVEYAQDYSEWLPEDVAPASLYVDPAAADYREQLKRHGHPVKPADNDVANGIEFTAGLLSAGRLTFAPACEHTIREIHSYQWDPKAQDKGEDKPLKEHDHHMDDLRYAMYSELAGKRAGLRTASAAL